MHKNNKYKRGSEWRKWDLHVHSKYSQESRAKLGIIEIFKNAINKEISVLSITDHSNVDGLDEIWSVWENETHNGLPIKEQIEFLPGVEMRTNSGGKSVHVVVIFPKFYKGNCNKVNKQYLQENFLNSLDFTKAEIEKSGSGDYSKGLFCKTTSFDQLSKCAKKLEGILIVHAGTKNNGMETEIDHAKTKNPDIHELLNSLGVEKTKIMKEYVDVCELPNGNEINLKERDFYFNNFHKPSIVCSDSHENYEGKNFTWIKADPVFEGLKQIVYESTDRLKIQELKPEEKKGYQSLDKVKFADQSFTTDEILINQNLTTIIGGKSTGKSILLRNIAQAIDLKEVENRLEEVGIAPYPKEISDFRVTWKDKQENKKGEDYGNNRKIIYIPQSYLNRLVDEREGKTSIDDIIKDVLKQENDVKEVFSNLENNKRETEKILTQNIENLFYKEKDKQELTENIKKNGDRNGIEAEIKKLKEEISELKKKSGMTGEEIRKYDELITESLNLKNQKISYQNDLNVLGNVKNQKIFNLPDLDDLSERIQKILSSEYFQITEKYQSEWINKINEKILIFQKDDLENDKKIIDNNRRLSPLLRKVIESEALDKKIKKLDEEEEKLRIITEQENNRLKLILSYEKLIRDISENHLRFYDELLNAKTEILKQRIITGELEFGIDIIPKDKTFEEDFIKDVCNLTTLANFADGFLNNYKIPKEQVQFKKDIEKIVNGILKDELKLVKKYSKKEAITRLVQDWFDFDYKIKQNGDEIADMSPGKKSLVLLKLLIELDNSKCPILLDQPEDDLDNRSIYNELVQFIKAKKKERQIIIATHNPNLVVGADSECVIVANQRGDKSKNETYKFEYVEGALENTFTIQGKEEVLYKQGIQEHVCDILEGGKIAFDIRKKKYNLNK